MSSISIEPGSLNDTWGIFLVGVIVTTALWGAATVQTYYYYNAYWKDPLFLRLIVGFAWIFDTLELIFESIIVYTILVTHYGQPTYLSSTPNIAHKAELFILMSGFVVILVQGFFAHRIWLLSRRNLYLAALFAFLSCTEFAFNTAIFVGFYHRKEIHQWLEITWIGIIINTLDATTSMLITSLSIYYLLRERTGFKRTETIVNRLIIYAVNTGLVTSICSILTLIFIAAEPSKMLYIFFYSLFGKLYFNSLLATLNSRNKIRQAAGSSSNNEPSDRRISFTNILDRRAQHESETNSKAIAITIQTEAHTVKDLDEPDSADKYSLQV